MDYVSELLEFVPARPPQLFSFYPPSLLLLLFYVKKAIIRKEEMGKTTLVSSPLKPQQFRKGLLIWEIGKFSQ